jgi:hypothetical protein
MLLFDLSRDQICEPGTRMLKKKNKDAKKEERVSSVLDPEKLQTRSRSQSCPRDREYVPGCTGRIQNT